MVAPAAADSGWSVAIIRDTDRQSAGAYAVGSRLHGAARVIGIESKRVFLQHDDRREYLDLDARAVETSPGTIASPARSLIADLDRGITRTGPGRYEIQRSTLDQLLGNVNALAGWVRVVPEQLNGRGIGLRLASVSASSPFARLGLQGGDLVSAINGFDLTSVDNALLAYTKLRAASHLTVDLVRGNLRMTIECSVR